MLQPPTQPVHAQIVHRVRPDSTGETVHSHLKGRVLPVPHAPQGITCTMYALGCLTPSVEFAIHALPAHIFRDARQRVYLQGPVPPALIVVPGFPI